MRSRPRASSTPSSTRKRTPRHSSAQAEQAITNGAKVILLVNLDSASGAAIIELARANGVAIIDYDRLTIEGPGADFYVSFDNESVGRLQGEGLVAAVEAAGLENPNVAVLNGSPTDNNATLFKNGYDGVINPLFESGAWTEVADQSVPTGTTSRPSSSSSRC
ncbi:MAG: substrate-binding domain-containing protein [Chloroflexi bacterium]|nr:substrate-binding domain-containing protein [Chloroflexota bacterium]